MADPGSGTCTFMFKKRNVKGRATRKRESSNSEEEKPDENSSETASSSLIKAPKRKQKLNPNVQHSSNKKIKNTEVSSDSDSSSNDESTFGVNYKSSKSVMSSGPQDQGATATLEIETEKDRDAQAIFEKKLEINKQLEGQADDKVYRGINNYAQYYKPKDTAAGNASSGLVRRGPIRAPANLRATVRWDYQPDICKDYKETGFCGFGDSCKFLHDRSDYKHGWQLEQEWDAGQYGKEDEDDKKYEIDSDSDLFPDECGICKGEFVRPVVSKCKHYFCEECAIAQYKKSMRCALCNTQTNGIFNSAKDLINHLKRAPKKKKDSDSDLSDSD